MSLRHGIVHSKPAIFPIEVMVEDARDRALRRLAATQHSAFSRKQAAQLGFGDRMIAARIANGTWRKIGTAVFAVGGSASTWHQKAMAFVLEAGDGAALSHFGAAFSHGLLDAPPTQLDVLVPSDRRPRGARITRAKGLQRSDVKFRDGIPVTYIQRTLIDLAGRLTKERLEAVVDTAIVKGLTTTAALRRYIAERGLTHLRGVGVLRRILDDRENGVPESELERMFERLVKRFKFPKPTRQARVGRRRVDFMYDAHKVYVELDGRSTHERRIAFEDDHVRQNEIALALKDYVRLGFT